MFEQFSGQLASKQYISISAFYMTVSCSTTSPTRRRSCTPESYSSFAVIVAFLALISGPLLGPNIVAAEGEELAHPAPTPTSRKGGELDAHDAAWAHSEQAYGRFWDFVAERKLVSACVGIVGQECVCMPEWPLPLSIPGIILMSALQTRSGLGHQQAGGEPSSA